ncbi:hypothetical protein BH10BAC3_BH10BAC3_24920 [soil metagenome]
MPAITDLVAHTFWRYQHINTVHFENGKYHLHQELKEAGDKNDSEKATNTAQEAQSSNEHVAVSAFYFFSRILFKQDLIAVNKRFIETSFSTNNYPPPKA